MSVAVIGAGIVGLTTASHVQKILPHVKVTIIADKFNTDTTSDGAAGLFLPASNFRGPSPSSAKEWTEYAFKYYEDLLNQDCGIFRISGYIISSQREEDVQNELIVGAATEYRAATRKELLQYPGNWKYGTYIRTLLIRCRSFLPWLMERITMKGGKVIKRTVQDLTDLAGQYDVIVNCTGLQAKQLCGDVKLAPVRGQILKVKSPVDQFLMVDSGDTYIIPNGDGIVSLGGTCQYNIWDARIRTCDSEGIRSRCAAVIPSLATAPVAWEWVGLRPFRDTVRVQPEIQGNLKIVHNYGHGGYGVTTAPGSARDAARYVAQLLNTQNKL